MRSVGGTFRSCFDAFMAIAPINLDFFGRGLQSAAGPFITA